MTAIRRFLALFTPALALALVATTTPELRTVTAHQTVLTRNDPGASGLTRPRNAAPAVQSVADPTGELRVARTVFVESKTRKLAAPLLEEQLQSRDAFATLGLVITRDADQADLVIQVTDGKFAGEFVYSVVAPRTRNLVASGRCNSVFGSAAARIAKDFVRKVAATR
jgi:hypothetical protein